MNDEDVDDGNGDDGDNGGPSTQVPVQGFPSDDDQGASIEIINIDFPGVDSVNSIDNIDWSVGPQSPVQSAIDGTTVELDYPDNDSNTYTADTFLELTVSASSGSYDADFVSEDDDSAVDSTDSFTI